MILLMVLVIVGILLMVLVIVGIFFMVLVIVVIFFITISLKLCCIIEMWWKIYFISKILLKIFLLFGYYGRHSLLFWCHTSAAAAAVHAVMLRMAYGMCVFSFSFVLLFVLFL